MNNKPSIENAYQLLRLGRTKEAIIEAIRFVDQLAESNTYQVQHWKEILDMGLSRSSINENQGKNGLISFDQYSLENNQVVYAVGGVIREIVAIFKSGEEEEGEKDSNSIVKQQLENSSWYLYSFNFPFKNIVRAILRIKKIQADENQVKLENPPALFPYMGFLDVRHARQHTFILKLVKNNKLEDSHLHIVFFSDLSSRDINNYCLGQLISFGDHKDITSCNIVLERITNGNDASATIFEENGKSRNSDESVPPVIVDYVNPSNGKLRISPRQPVIKTLSDLQTAINKY
ncbi:MAG: hypothetical protein R2828_29590 [Saprospiraceae bacterium]